MRKLRQIKSSHLLLTVAALLCVALVVGCDEYVRVIRDHDVRIPKTRPGPGARLLRKQPLPETIVQSLRVTPSRATKLHAAKPPQPPMTPSTASA